MGLVYDATAWTRAHDAWLRRQRFQSGPLAIVFDECYGRVLDAKTRRDALDEAIAELAASRPYVDVVGRLVCLRGVSTPTALALTVELGDWSRFRPESLGPFLGLTPSEKSSGERRRQGAITKTGNTHARRLLVEAAWHQRRPPRISAVLARRRSGNPAAVRAQADRSARRLHSRWHALEARGKPRSIVVVRGRARARRTLLGARDDGVAAPATARRGERTGATTRGATRENTVSSPHRPRSTPENGTAPHLAHPVMRHQPAHMSRDTDVDDSRCAPPADPNPANQRGDKPLRD
jgi:hypothetical protein